MFNVDSQSSSHLVACLLAAPTSPGCYGRYIRIEALNTINLMEVRVYSTDGVPITGLTATMDRQYPYGFPASNCVDGNDSTMCHSKDDGQSGWLEIDMGLLVHHYVRLACCSFILLSYRVFSGRFSR